MDRRIVSAIVFVDKNGLRSRNAPPDYGLHKTIDNRFGGGSRLGRVQDDFHRTDAPRWKTERIMINAAD
jgi:putative transposase